VGARNDLPGRTPRYPTRPRVVLFDLDGTLSDSAPGILSSLRYALAANGVEPLDAHTERSLLGPPFYESLPPLIGGEEKLAAVIEAYRTRYVGGDMYDTRAYDGIGDVLDFLHGCDITLAVATSKPEHYAIPIVEHLGFARYFATIGGDELDGSLRTKALVIGKVLRRLAVEPSSDVVMIGDRSHDVHGAREHGLRCIGVRWGYAQPGELEQAGADPICRTPADLLPALGLAG
jgi:phosphoglycolate phosphatase